MRRRGSEWSRAWLPSSKRSPAGTPGLARRGASWLQELSARLQKEEAKLLVELGRPGTTAELAERLNLREEAVEELQIKGMGPAVLSLTERAGDDEDGGGIDLSKIRSQHSV